MKTPILPDWYLDGSATGGIGHMPTTRSRLGRPIRRTLVGFASALASEFGAETRGISWLGETEPRAKLVAVFILIFGTTFLHRIETLTIMWLTAIALSVTCRVGWRRIAGIWIGVPLFSLAIILPAILNIVTPGRPLVELCHFEAGAKFGPWALPASLSITGSGLVVALRFLLRSMNCVTLMLVLVATTGHSALISSLRRLGLPRVFGMVLQMMQRYLVVLLRVGEELHLAKLSRTICAHSLRKEQSWVAAGIGILFSKANRLAQGVHEAMISRGYDGEIRVAGTTRFKTSDLLVVVLSIALMASLLAVDRRI